MDIVSVVVLDSVFPEFDWKPGSKGFHVFPRFDVKDIWNR